MADTEYAVETTGLSKSFPADSGWRRLFQRAYRIALQDVSIQIRHGEVFGLLGPNGAGKTTLMKILATLVRPNAGTACVNGMDVLNHGAEVRRAIGVVYGDERTFFWRLSVRENLRFYGGLYAVPARDLSRRIDYLLDAVGLREVADVRMDRFSTGMKQRASIARGLLSKPEILFMDEPTRSLDPVGAHDIWDLVRELLVADGRTTVLLCTNNMQEAELLCSRVALINHGSVQLMGPVATLGRTLLAHDRHRLVLSGLQQQDLDRLDLLPGVLWTKPEPIEGDRWQIDLAVEWPDAIPAVIHFVVNAGGAVWSCTPEELSLEQIFHLAVRPPDGPPAAFTPGRSS